MVNLSPFRLIATCFNLYPPDPPILPPLRDIIYITVSALFSIRVILVQLVSFIAVTNRLICQCTGNASTNSKKYVAYPYSGRSRTILYPSKIQIFHQNRQAAEKRILSIIMSIFDSRPVMFIENKNERLEISAPTPFNWPFSNTQVTCLQEM